VYFDYPGCKRIEAQTGNTKSRYYNVLINFCVQEDALKSITLGKDVFVILPTGYGKSLIYAVLPTLYDFMFGEFFF